MAPATAENQDESQDFTPRDYQIDLYEQAVESNSILYLPTGAGKTFIAIMLIKKLSSSVRVPWDEGGKRTVFIVNTVPLVKQQTDYINRHTDLTCGGFSGDMNVDYWTEDIWMSHIRADQVMVMTAQIFVDLLNHGYFPLSRVNLIIFDECHHGVNDHPMRQIMKTFQHYDKSDHPRILGMSATLLNSNIRPNDILIPIRNLEITFNAKVISVDSIDSVAGYGKPRERIIHYNDTINNPIGDELNQILDYCKQILKVVKIQENVYQESSVEFQTQKKTVKLTNNLEDIRIHINEQGLYSGNLGILYHIVQFERLKNAMDDLISLTTLDFLKTQLVQMRKIISNQMNESTEIENMMKYCSNKLISLFSVIKKFYEETPADQKFCIIIFVNRRFSAKILYHVLKKLAKLNDEFKFLIPNYVVGNSGNPYRSPVENMCISKWNSEGLIKFRNGLINCLITTNVLDEGVDIPACSVVVQYDTPNDYRSYVQSRGRARFKDSHYVIFKKKTDDAFGRRYEDFQEIERNMKNYLVGNTKDRNLPKDEEIINSLYSHEIKPYSVTNENGISAQISEVAAIPLVNKYCSKLCRSNTSLVVPTYKLHKIGETIDGNFKNAPLKYQVSIRLPMISPLRDEIYGDVMNSIVSAKRSAALEVCKKLHEINELTDQLLPRDINDMIEDITSLLKNWREESPDSKEKIGETKCKRFYDLIYPQVFYATFPQADQDCYLHIINIKPIYPAPFENRNRVFYNLLNSQSGYAILTSKKMPKLPQFGIFMNMGEVNVKLQSNHKTLKLSSKEIEKLRQFHWLIFRDILELIKSFMICDKSNKENSFLIVPVNSSWNIDWPVVNQYKSIVQVSGKNSQKAITDGTNGEAPENYSNWELVSPTYRSSTNIYVVTKVCDNLNPRSTFPTEDYLSYEHYFSEKHSIVITDMYQPLLEVKPVSKKINYIRKRPPKSLTKRKRDDLEEHLIPELCCRIVFPALYWVKAMSLPSILHRVCQLLLAEDLRQEIAAEAGLGVASATATMDEKNWDTLRFDNEEVVLTDNESASDNEDAAEDSSTPMDTEDNEVDHSTVKVTESEINILSLNSEVYPWIPENEPIDIERNIDNIQLMDIEYFSQFLKCKFDQFDDPHTNIPRTLKIIKSSIQAPNLSILNKISSTGPTSADILPAITAKCAHDSINLERLETLGDAFLKFFASLFLFETYPDQMEGRLTGFKGKMIGNRHLYYCGVNKKIPGKLKVDDFEPWSNFIAPSYSVPSEIQNLITSNNKSPNVLYEITIPPEDQLDGKLNDETRAEFKEKIDSWIEASVTTGVENFIGIQMVPDKTVADCVEALTGVYLKTMGFHGGARLLQWFGVIPDSADLHSILHGKPRSALIGQGNPIDHMNWINSIESVTGYQFRDRSFLLQAFTHSSYSPNRCTLSYDRLEFLGDAIIDILITIYIYENCGNLGPGELTDLRSALVNNITFACLTVKYKLHVALLAYASSLDESIGRFVKFQEERDHVIDDELLWILLEEDDCDIAEYVDVPKVLGDLFESIIGAIYLDSGKDLHKVWEILYSFMHKEIDNFSKKVPKQAIRVLYETPGANPKFVKFEVLEESKRVMVTLQVKVNGKMKHFHGVGATKKQAKVGAAKRALKSLRQLH